MGRWTVLWVALVLPAGASADVVWRGDFETGKLVLSPRSDTQEWNTTQAAGTDRLQLVSDVATQGRYALKATVVHNDIASSGARAEVVRWVREKPNDEFFYRWYTLFPEGFPAPADRWQLFVQWHHDGSGGSPPLEFVVNNNQIRLVTHSAPAGDGSQSQAIHWRTPLVRGQWHEFVLRVVWSPDSTRALIDLYFNGVQVASVRNVATMFPGQNNYMKAGLYRHRDILETGVVYHDGFIQATTFEDVRPRALDAGTPAPVDAGTPPAPVDAGTPVSPPDAGTPPESLPEDLEPGTPPQEMPSAPQPDGEEEAPAPVPDATSPLPPPAGDSAASAETNPEAAPAAPQPAAPGAEAPATTGGVEPEPLQGCSASGGTATLLGLLVLPLLARRRRR